MKKRFGKQWIAAVFGVILAVAALAPGAAIQWLFAGEGGEVLALCATRTDYTICRFDPAAESLSPAWHISAQNAPTGVVRRALWQEGTIVIE